jgi:hypothetical protein
MAAAHADSFARTKFVGQDYCVRLNMIEHTDVGSRPARGWFLVAAIAAAACLGPGCAEMSPTTLQGIREWASGQELRANLSFLQPQRCGNTACLGFTSANNSEGIIVYASAVDAPVHRVDYWMLPDLLFSSKGLGGDPLASRRLYGLVLGVYGAAEHAVRPQAVSPPPPTLGRLHLTIDLDLQRHLLLTIEL